MTISYRRFMALAGLLAVTSLARATRLEAQTAATSRFHLDSGNAVPSQLNLLARERAARWAGAAPVVHCSPAPLTERPGIEAEFNRPSVVPLESAFADAARIKRSVASLRIRTER
jgi:hypothetical protein